MQLNSQLFKKHFQIGFFLSMSSWANNKEGKKDRQQQIVDSADLACCN